MDFSDICHSINRTLLKRAFAAHYIERRLVNSLGEYRDVIWLTQDEREIADDLASAGQVYNTIFPNGFPSFTDSSVNGASTNPSLWVQLSDLPFGCHWFQIKAINIGQREISYVLEHLRSLPNVNFSKQDQQQLPKSVGNEMEFKKIYDAFLLDAKLFFFNIGRDDIKNIFMFLLVLITTLITGLFHVVRLTGDFTLKFLREASFFVHNSTPVFLGILDFFSKLVGGLYILLAMLWRGNRKPNTRYREQIQYHPKYN